MVQFENEDEAFFEVMPEMPHQGRSAIAKGASGMVQSARVISSVLGDAANTAPQETVMITGNTVRYHSRKKENMILEPLKSSDAFKNAQRAREQQVVPIIPETDIHEFKATVVDTTAFPDCRIIAFKGIVDQNQQEALENFLESNLPRDEKRVILDLDGLILMNSSGWGVMVRRLQHLRRNGGGISLCGLHGEVERCFKILDLDKLFSVFPSIADAVQNSLGADEFPQRKKPSPAASRMQPAPALISLEDKIRHIVAEDPNCTVGQIAALLGSDAYGATRISRWKLNSKLTEMGLGTKEERYRFFRSS